MTKKVLRKSQAIFNVQLIFNFYSLLARKANLQHYVVLEKVKVKDHSLYKVNCSHVGSHPSKEIFKSEKPFAFIRKWSERMVERVEEDRAKCLWSDSNCCISALWH